MMCLNFNMVTFYIPLLYLDADERNVKSCVLVFVSQHHQFMKVFFLRMMRRVLTAFCVFVFGRKESRPRWQQTSR